MSDPSPSCRSTFPPGHPAKAHTISVGAPAVDAHLAHGDTPGRCAGYAIARLDVRGGPQAQLDGIETGSRPLVLPPLVDGGGYSLVVRQGPSSRRVERIRRRQLALEPASLEQVGWRL